MGLNETVVADSDTELIRKIRAGEHEAFRVLVDRYAPMVFRLAHRFTAGSQDREDLAQDIFIKVYSGLDRFEDGTNFSVWLYTVAANHCRDYAKNVRRSVKPMSHIEGEPYEKQLRQVETQDREIERAERAAHLRWALGQISPDYATVFLMKYEAGLPYTQMAEDLDTTVGALKVKVHRARQELQKLLKHVL